MINLNLGAGDWRPVDYLTVDREGTPNVTHDLAVLPWPFADASADRILASHILEHVSQADGVRFVAECRRTLAPGGVLRIAVPDLDLFIACHLAGDFAPLGGYAWTDLNSLMGGSKEYEGRPHWRHRYMYCFNSLAMTLLGAGFTTVRRHAYEAGLDNPAYKDISLYVEAT